MDLSAGYPESPMEPDDIAFPCKGCGEILEEGKAFELAGNRWHIDCFRCNTCGTILDSDANLLLLGDGSLICNDCTYSCSVCGNKIEDLAILTGDQAFCGPCFKCRNCKKKIENLKYARTSQGIFCMDCHESLMQRRRKKNHKNGLHTRHKHPQPTHAGNTIDLGKSLPSLPPSAVDRKPVPDESSPPSEILSEPPIDLLPVSRQRPSGSRSRSEQAAGGSDIPRAAQKRPPYPRSLSSRSDRRDTSPPVQEDDKRENLSPPMQTTNRSSTYSQNSDGAGNDFIPMVLDSNPAPGPSPLNRRENFQREASSPPQPEYKPNSRDYLTTKNTIPRKPTTRDQEDSPRMHQFQDSPSVSRHSSQPNSPHIAYQERGRTLSSELAESGRRRKDHHGNNSINAIANETHRELVSGESRAKRNGETQQNGRFTLGEVPKHKKAEKRPSKDEAEPPPILDSRLPSSKAKSTSGSTNAQVREQQVTVSAQDSPSSSQSEATLSGSPRETQPPNNHASADSPPSRSPPLATQLTSLPERGDSLARGTSTKGFGPRRDPDVGPAGKLSNATPAADIAYEQPASAPPATNTQSSSLPISSLNGSRGLAQAPDVPSANDLVDVPPPPLRNKERLALQQGSSGDAFATPRAPPQPPSSSYRTKTDPANNTISESSRNLEQPPSPQLAKYADKSDSTADEDLTRAPSGPDGAPDAGGFLRRMSNSVRHARSYSDRGTRMSREQKWPKSPMLPTQSSPYGQDVHTPLSSSPENRESITWFKNELRRERQKAAEKEQRLVELEAALEAKSTINQMNTELREKRSTIVVLDTQKEIVVRELEVLTEHIAAAKKSSEPLDFGRMSNTVLREFAENLQELKDSFTPQIEELLQQRIELNEELGRLAQAKEKSFQEFEQLSAKNAQLADLNNQLVHQIQELIKANPGPALDNVRPSPNGLGIYTSKDRTAILAADQRDSRPSITDSNLTGSTALPDQDTDSQAYLSAAPQVVNIRKAQPKKFNWKKGGHNVAKGVTKGLKGAFSSEGSKAQREGSFTEGIPYGAMSQQEYPSTSHPTRGQGPEKREGFGAFFGDRKQRPQQWKNSPNGSSPAVHTENGPPLFGSELEVRADFERGVIPGIVMRCIQEVDARGMDNEGIYRKSGGNSQIQVIKEGFERNNDYDISDPDLDINAVTSTLKQYFRKLPTPLITYEVYDKLLETATPSLANAETLRDIDPTHPAHPSNPNNHGYKVNSMRHAISELPPRHRDTLEFLMFHLARVIEQERENLMTSLNLAVVFAPTIMRPESLAREMQDTQAKNSAVQFLIENCQGIFMGGGGSGTRSGESARDE